MRDMLDAIPYTPSHSFKSNETNDWIGLVCCSLNHCVSLKRGSVEKVQLSETVQNRTRIEPVIYSKR